MTTRTSDLLFGSLTTVIFLFVYLLVIPAEVPVESTVRVAALAPDFWPRVIAGGLVLLGLMQIAVALAHKPGPLVPSLDPKSRRMVVGLCAVLVIFPLCVPFLGFLVSSVLAMAVSMWLFGERRLAVMLLGAVGLPALLQFFFVRVAGVLIPTGLFPF